MDVNTNGVLYTAQAAGREMARFGNGGSIVLIASMSGSITNKVQYQLALYPPRYGTYPQGADGGTSPGPRVGVVQHEQVGGAADGAEHGVRAGREADTRQHALAGTHLHIVSRSLHLQSETGSAGLRLATHPPRVPLHTRGATRARGRARGVARHGGAVPRVGCLTGSRQASSRRPYRRRNVHGLY